MEYQEWKLTDEEFTQIGQRGGDVLKAQEVKRKAYIQAGGIILNPDALPDLYEACKIALLLSEQPILQDNAEVQMLSNTLKSAIAKAE